MRIRTLSLAAYRLWQVINLCYKYLVFDAKIVSKLPGDGECYLMQKMQSDSCMALSRQQLETVSKVLPLLKADCSYSTCIQYSPGSYM